MPLAAAAMLEMREGVGVWRLWSRGLIPFPMFNICRSGTDALSPDGLVNTRRPELVKIVIACFR